MCFFFFLDATFSDPVEPLTKPQRLFFGSRFPMRRASRRLFHRFLVHCYLEPHALLSKHFTDLPFPPPFRPSPRLLDRPILLLCFAVGPGMPLSWRRFSMVPIPPPFYVVHEGTIFRFNSCPDARHKPRLSHAVFALPCDKRSLPLMSPPVCSPLLLPR